MTNECKGYWFQVGSDRYYECFWQNTVLLKNDDCPSRGSSCPHCELITNGTNYEGPILRTLVLQQVILPNGRILTLDSETTYHNPTPPQATEAAGKEG